MITQREMKSYKNLQSKLKKTNSDLKSRVLQGEEIQEGPLSALVSHVIKKTPNWKKAFLKIASKRSVDRLMKATKKTEYDILFVDKKEKLVGIFDKEEEDE